MGQWRLHALALLLLTSAGRATAAEQDSHAPTASPAPQSAQLEPVFTLLDPFVTPVGANDPEFAADVMRDEDPVEFAAVDERAPRGLLQRVFFSATRLSPGDDDDLGQMELKLHAMLGFPFPTTDSPLLATPGLSLYYLDGFQTLDVPDSLYDAFVEFRTLRPWSETWLLDLGVTPGVYGEMDRGDESEFRLQGRAVAVYSYSPTMKWACGLLYLDRDDVPVLPAGGLIWNPSPDWQFDLVFPEPRAAMRTHHDPCGPDVWVYVGGEFGGGQWGVTRAWGAPDVLTMRDLRFLTGFELKTPEIALRVEAGLVFGRQVEYRSGIGDMELESTGMVRAALIY